MTDQPYFCCGEDSYKECSTESGNHYLYRCSERLAWTDTVDNPYDVYLKSDKMQRNRVNSPDNRPYTERRDDQRTHSYSCILKVVCFVYMLMCIFVPNCSAHTTICDFKGSGLDWKGQGVQPVYLSCSSGRVEWRHPRAALRILLQFPSDNRDFHGCIKASPAIEGARLYVEGHRSLVPLYSSDDGLSADRNRCFTSYKGRAALYFEAEPSTGFKDLKAAFEYDLQPIPKGQLYDPMEECRPCTDDELVRLYCSSDFAARGTIVSVEDDLRLQHTRVTLAASRVFQQTKSVFSKKVHLAPLHGGEELQRVNWEAPTSKDVWSPSGEIQMFPRLLGDMFLPLACEAKAGFGEFMVLGSVRLGLPMLRCAPKIEDWKKIVRTAQDKAHCVLEV